MKDTAAIIVTYNRKELLHECIKSIINQKNASCDILVIDNHSTDGTMNSLNEYIHEKKIIYYDTGKNLGGAGGFNEGIKHGTLLGYKYLWIMDDDCIPTENALRSLKTADQELHGEYGFLSSKVLWKDGSICKMNVQRQTIARNVSNSLENISPIIMASFVSLFVKSDIIKQIGLPIKEFYIWTDDWEFTRRISKKYTSFIVPSSLVIHKSVSNIPADISIDDASRIGRYFFLYRNDAFLYKREGIKGFCYYFLKVLYNIFKILFNSKNNKIIRLITVCKGVIKGLFFKPHIEYV